MTAFGKKILDDYLSIYNNKSDRWVARLLCKEYPLHFKDLERCRYSVRYRRGHAGKNNLKKVSVKHLTDDKIIEKYNLPAEIKNYNYDYYIIKTDNALILADIHFPFQCNKSITAALDYGKNKNVDTIILDGDILDGHAISHFPIESLDATLELELEYCIQFLEMLKKEFPNAEIYFKSGNHEVRLNRYISENAPALRGVKKLNIESFLELDRIGINFIPDWQIIDLDGLYVLHGHEYKSYFRSGKALYNKVHDNAVCAHSHIIDQHGDRTIGDIDQGAWLIGCLCDLHPNYRPHNNWANGFGYFKRYENGLWTFKNKRTINGQVV